MDMMAIHKTLLCCSHEAHRLKALHIGERELPGDLQAQMVGCAARHD